MLGPTGAEGPPMAERGGEQRARRARRAASLTVAALALGAIAVLGAALAGPIHRLGLLGARWALGLFGLAALLGLAAAVLAAWGIGLALLARAWRSVAGSGLALLVAFVATATWLLSCSRSRPIGPSRAPRQRPARWAGASWPPCPRKDGSRRPIPRSGSASPTTSWCACARRRRAAVSTCAPPRGWGAATWGSMRAGSAPSWPPSPSRGQVLHCDIRQSASWASV